MFMMNSPANQLGKFKYVTKINRRNKNKRPLVRIHAIGFPVMRAQPTEPPTYGIKFASLMRKLAN